MNPFYVLIGFLIWFQSPAVVKNEIVWQCQVVDECGAVLYPNAPKGEVITLACTEKGKQAFTLDIPRAQWPEAWKPPGLRMWYGGGLATDRTRHALPTWATACDLDFMPGGMYSKGVSLDCTGPGGATNN